MIRPGRVVTSPPERFLWFGKLKDFAYAWQSMLAFFPLRRAIVHAREQRLSIHDPNRTTNVEVGQSVTAVATYNDGVLFATQREAGTGASVHRLAYGASSPTWIADVEHDVSAISASPTGTYALLAGARASHLACGDTTTVTAVEAIEAGVALPDGRWVTMRRSAIELHGPSSTHEPVLAIRRDGRFVFADSLGEPAALLFVYNQATHSVVQHLNLRTRVASTGLLVPLSSSVCVARARRMALLSSSAEQQVYLLDLRIGRLLASHAIPDRVSDIDIDATGDEVALVCDGRLTLVGLSDLMSGRSVVAGAAPDETASPVVGLSREAPVDDEGASEAVLEPEAAIALSEIPVPTGLALPDPIDPLLAEVFLARAFDLVAALCRRAIAIAWDTGRLAFHEASALPYEGEVDALLRRNPPRAPAKVAAADNDIFDAAQVCRFLWSDAVLAPGNQLVNRSVDDSLAHEIDWPLRGLIKEFSLSPVACDILLALLAPGGRPEFARLFAIIRNDPARPLCDEMLLGQLLEPRAPIVAIAAELEAGAPLLRFGLVRRGDGERIFAPLTVEPAVMARLRAMPLVDVELGDVTAANELWIAKDAVPALERALVDAEPPLRLLIRGRRGAGRRTLAAMIAHAAQRPCAQIDLQTVSKKEMLDWLRARLVRASVLGHLPCVSGLDEPDIDAEIQAALLRIVRDHQGPLIMRGRPEWTPGSEVRVTTLDLPKLSETGRRQVWQQRLDGLAAIEPSAIDTLATRHAVGPGRIIAVTDRIDASATPAQATDIIEARLADARESRLGSVASRITKLTRWDDVVLPDDVWQRIQELMARVKFRRQVYETWGFQNVATTSLGITALFQGGPGTGKTLVAGAIARELDYELYRVDVSRIVSKWIGETEKNLAQIFDSAEDGRLVLLFDEADTLFAKRTEVKTSTDRYANSEVNFLLQRLDTFQGVALLTTNRPGAMDPAFQRRLSMAVTFPEPDEDLRERIWQVHIPKAVPRDPDLDLADIARSHQFSGGHIRNAVMRALFFAASEGAPLGQAHLVEAIRLEYQNLGKLSQGGAVGW